MDPSEPNRNICCSSILTFGMLAVIAKRVEGYSSSRKSNHARAFVITSGHATLWHSNATSKYKWIKTKERIIERHDPYWRNDSEGAGRARLNISSCWSSFLYYCSITSIQSTCNIALFICIRARQTLFFMTLAVTIVLREWRVSTMFYTSAATNAL
jgi:hypothetical protein